MPMYTELLALLATVMAMLAAIVLAPDSAQCPRGWYVNGARSSGRYECRQSPAPNDESPEGLELHYESRVYCTGGARAIVVNERTVGCQR